MGKKRSKGGRKGRKLDDEEKRNTEKKRGNKMRTTKRKMGHDKDNDKQDDKGDSFKRNRPNLTLRLKFYGVTL